MSWCIIHTRILNDHESFVVDSVNEVLYVYGGIRGGDLAEKPTNDFYRLNMETLRWENLTDMLRYVPDTRTVTLDSFYDLPKKGLPALNHTAYTVFHRNGHPLLMIFGGFDGDSSTAGLICVDPTNRTWSNVVLAGRAPRPRIDAAIVAHKNSLFIFGGREEPGDIRAAKVISTYSVATLGESGQWTWSVTDERMPNLGSHIQACPVYGGKMILLTAGRMDKETTTLSAKTSFEFHTESHTFQPQYTRGVFPGDMAWHRLFSIEHLTPPSSPRSPDSPNRPAKRARKEEEAPQRLPPSALIIGWMKHGSEDLVPEAWQYMLHPEQRVACLQIKHAVYDLELDLQDFVVVGNQMLLLGNASAAGEERKERVGQAYGDLQANGAKWKRWEVAIEIPFGDLELTS
ncbi:hypothetical protein MKEN_00001000 [Mycena kentingensis (nom. inval.)]|nr:hypothetical protein MKEN_00001000 [Mycena kentingensis (nom. inval.)]